MRYIVAGSRTFNNYALMDETLKSLNLNKWDEIVCGDAKGADLMGAQWSYANNIRVQHFPADWDSYGYAAGPIRNEQMADYADILIAFWDGKSRGTANMIKEMKNRGKHGKVIRY